MSTIEIDPPTCPYVEIKEYKRLNFEVIKASDDLPHIMFNGGHMSLSHALELRDFFNQATKYILQEVKKKTKGDTK